MALKGVTGRLAANAKEYKTESEFIKTMKEVCADYSLYEYEDFLKTFKEAVRREILAGRTIRLRRLFQLEVKDNPDRISNLVKGKVLKGRRSLRFKLSQEFKNQINKERDEADQK